VKVLLLDVDPQANTTGGLGFSRDEATAVRLRPVYSETPRPAEVILPTDVENLSLIPGTKNMIGANVELVGVERREHRLREALEPDAQRLSLYLPGLPAGLDLLTLNSLVAADTLLVPMQAEYFALEGISELMATLDRVSASFNPELSIEGVLLTMFDDRTNLSQQVRDNLQTFFEDKLFKTTIPRNIRLAEAPSHGKPVALYDPRSRGRRGLSQSRAGAARAQRHESCRRSRAQAKLRRARRALGESKGHVAVSKVMPRFSIEMVQGRMWAKWNYFENRNWNDNGESSGSTRSKQGAGSKAARAG
jgi:chromosome partitioning protein